MSSEEFTNDFINSIRDHGRVDLPPLPGCGRAARRRHPVPVGQGADAGGVLPHLQHAAQRQQADRDHLRSATQAAAELRGPDAVAVRVGPDHRHSTPDLETRIAILRKKTMQERREISDEVLEFIASKITANIRELEGALIRISAFASLNSSPISVDLAEIVLKDLIPHESARDVTADQIKARRRTTSGSPSTIWKARRDRRPWSVPGRWPCICAGNSLTSHCRRSGLNLATRDHTTVMHADRKIPQEHQ